MTVVPQTNPYASYIRQKIEIDQAISGVLNSGIYINGPEVNSFEQSFAEWTKTKHAIAVGSGTDGLAVALSALGIRSGDRVITVSHTAVATVSAIEMIGGVPILVDIDEYFCMSANALEASLDRLRSIKQRVGAIVPVHLYGQAADMQLISEIAENYGVPVLEDCSQAHGASLSGRLVGNFGQVAVYSFYPTKNLGCFGDGGIIVTSDERLAEACRALREYGWIERFVSEIPGRNSRLDEIQAAILRVKLPMLHRSNLDRQRIANIYDDEMSSLGLTVPRVRAGANHVYHQYVVRTKNRNELRSRLLEMGINTGIHYPVPVHLQPAYIGRDLTNGVCLQNTEVFSKEILSLPIYPEMTDQMVRKVVDTMACALRLR